MRQRSRKAEKDIGAEERGKREWKIKIGKGGRKWTDREWNWNGRIYGKGKLDRGTRAEKKRNKMDGEMRGCDERNGRRGKG